MTAEQFIEWIEHGTNPPTIDEARRELIAINAVRQTVMESIDKLMDDLTVDADKAITAIAYRAERASEYAILCSVIQRLADIALAAASVAQK
jgi:hypothetical protein